MVFKGKLSNSSSSSSPFSSSNLSSTKKKKRKEEKEEKKNEKDGSSEEGGDDDSHSLPSSSSSAFLLPQLSLQLTPIGNIKATATEERKKKEDKNSIEKKGGNGGKKTSSSSSSSSAPLHPTITPEDFIFIAVPKNAPISEEEGKEKGKEKEKEGEDGRGEEVTPSANKLSHYLICFPADGRQPTTEEAVVYSCANVPCTNPDTDPITRWYMEMFGVISRGESIICGFYSHSSTDSVVKSEHNTESFANSSLESVNSDKESTHTNKFYIMCGKMDTTNPHAQTQIINFHQNFNNYQNAFIRSFIQIASNPVGRLLLYRLLIEIIKSDHTKTTIVSNTEEEDFWSDDEGKNKKSITLKFERGKISYSYENSELILDLFNSEERESFCVKKWGHGFKIAKMEGLPIAISIFHEMLHWFHYLLDSKKVGFGETSSINDKVDDLPDLSNFSTELSQRFPILKKYYYDNRHPGNIWKADQLYDFSVEEMSVILGDFDDNGQNIGYELSENLFRCSLSYQLMSSKKIQSPIPIRLGHFIDLNPTRKAFEINADITYPLINAHKTTVKTMNLIQPEAAAQWKFNSEWIKNTNNNHSDFEFDGAIYIDKKYL
jgi:hypothetical protein